MLNKVSWYAAVIVDNLDKSVSRLDWGEQQVVGTDTQNRGRFVLS